MGGLLAMADCDGHGAVGGRHVAAGEHAGPPRHHVRPDLDHAILDRDPRRMIDEGEVDVLAEREDEGVRLEGLELAGRLRKPLLVELHLLDGHRAALDRPDGREPFHRHALLQGLLDLEVVRRHFLAG